MATTVQKPFFSFQKELYMKIYVLLHRVLKPYIFEKNNGFNTVVPFHRIFCEIVITVLNSKKLLILKNKWI